MRGPILFSENPNIVFAVILLLSFSFFAPAQTSGKLSGVVKSADGEPLIGVNVLVVGTELGAATDLDGSYFILNVRAGTYSLQFEYLGYQTRVVEDVRVSADKTTRIDAVLSPETITGQEVVVTAEKPLVEFSVTSTVATVTSEDIALLPVQSLDDIVNLQAGVIDGHFRGGRLGEVQYQVDGVTVNNPYDNKSTLRLDRSVLEEVQVVSGTFDAKYGQAMSGVVNAVLKSGSERFEYSGEIYGGDYYTSDEERYPNNQLDDFNPVAIHNFQLTLSGPVPLPKTTFFASGRWFENEGYLFGERRFMPTDSNNLEIPVLYPTGDGKIVSMNSQEEWSGQFKLSNRSISNVQVSYQAVFNDLTGQTYNNAYRFDPEGIKTQHTFSISHGLDWIHTLSSKLFYKLNVRQNYFDYSDYVYEDSTKYIEAGPAQGHPNYEYGAFIEGVDFDRFNQVTNALVGKGEVTWQASPVHLLEGGIEAQGAEMTFGPPGYYVRYANGEVQIRNANDPDFRPDEPLEQTYYPLQLAAYLQDRVEWGDLVIRAGLRLEMFDAQSNIPSNLRNPANAIPGSELSYPQETTVKTSLAPRLGLSFPITSLASIYFSYGHFYQMPGLGNLYNHADYSILKELQEGGANYRTVMGNPDLKPELTAQYEFGLKQALSNFVGLEFVAFYKDIRDLLGVEIITTDNVSEYVRYTNVDFGSAYGFTVALDQRFIGPLSSSVDYTFQAARGNSSDPDETATRAEAGKDPRPRDIPFNWDQTHTLNAQLVLAQPRSYSLSAILRLGSGQPYTPSMGSGFNAQLETNSGRKDPFALVDLRAEKFFNLGTVNMSVFGRVFNLFNEHFVNGFVFSTTGTPDYSQYPEVDVVGLSDPGRFYQPRRIEFGFSFLR